MGVKHAVRLQHEVVISYFAVTRWPLSRSSLRPQQASSMASSSASSMPDAQAARLAARGDDPSLLVHHQAFAQWMRQQATDPLHRLDVVATNGWGEMRWDRVPQAAVGWVAHVIDTTELTPQDTAAAVLSWLRSTPPHPLNARARLIPSPKPASCSTSRVHEPGVASDPGLSGSGTGRRAACCQDPCGYPCGVSGGCCPVFTAAAWNGLP